MMTLLIILALCALSWVIVCAFIKLITMCFGLAFSWAIATGIGLIICLINFLFKK